MGQVSIEPGRRTSNRLQHQYIRGRKCETSRLGQRAMRVCHAQQPTSGLRHHSPRPMTLPTAPCLCHRYQLRHRLLCVDSCPRLEAHPFHPELALTWRRRRALRRPTSSWKSFWKHVSGAGVLFGRQPQSRRSRPRGRCIPCSQGLLRLLVLPNLSRLQALVSVCV